MKHAQPVWIGLLKIPPQVCDNNRQSIIDNLHNFRRNTARSHQDFSTSGCAKFGKPMTTGASECQKQRT